MIQVTGKQIVECARTYIGTPWHHAARLKGVGVDCAGLLVCVSNELGVPVEDFVNYDREDEFLQLTSIIDKYCREVQRPPREGDILVFRARQMYNHCGFYTADNTLVHAYNTPGVNRVIETPYDASWELRRARTYEYVGISLPESKAR